MSLCFAAACQARSTGSISNVTYLQNLLTHLEGARHHEDDPQHIPQPGSFYDFAASLRNLALHTRYETVKGRLLLGTSGTRISDRTNLPPDVVTYAKLFTSCAEDDLLSVEHGYDEIKRRPALPDPMQPLVTLAIANSHAEITRFCFKHGAAFDDYASHAASDCLKTQAMLDTLIAVNWMDLKDYVEAPRDLEYRHENAAITLMKWKLKYSGGLEPRRPQRPLDGNFTLPVVKLVVKELGVEALRNTGTLQLAATLGDGDIVGFLLDAGADVNEIPAPLDEREGLWPTTALHEALVTRQLGTAQLLLDHDATIEEDTVQRYRDKGDAEIVTMLESELEKRASFPLVRV